MKLFPEKTQILILTHYTFRSENAEDTDQRVRRYLKDKVKKIIHITQPLPEYGSRHSYCLIYENGKKVKEEKVLTIKGPFIVQYINHTLLIYYFLFKNGFNFDLCIAMENLSFIGIWPLRITGLVKRLVYYSIDFVPVRFPNPLLNWLYRKLFVLSNKFSDRNWVMAKEQIKAAKKIGIKKSNSAPFYLVPIGYETSNIKILPPGKIDFYNLVYAGAIRESMGPELAIKSMPHLVQKNPKIKLTLIGTGKDLQLLKDLTKKLKLQKHITFLGYVESFDEMTKILSKKSIGLAPYKPMAGSFSYFSDPSKIKLYMVCGLPVITTDVTTMAPLITKTNSGIVIKYSVNSFVKAVLSMLSNQDKYARHKQSAIKLSLNFDINNILDSTIKNLP